MPEGKPLRRSSDYRIELWILRALLTEPKTHSQLAEELNLSREKIESVIGKLFGENWVIYEEEELRPYLETARQERKLMLTEDGTIRASIIRDLSVFDWCEEDIDQILKSGCFEKLSEAVTDGWARAAYVLGEIGDERAATPLIQALKSKKKGARKAAAWALSRIKDRRGVEPLVDLLEDHQRNVRQQAAITLGEIGDIKAIEPLIEQLYYHERSIWPDIPIRALAKIGAPAVSPLTDAYIQALKDGKVGFLYSVASTFGKMTDVDAVMDLIEALEHGDSILQYGAALGLGNTRAIIAVEPLIRALKNKDWMVRSHAAIALGEIGDARGIEPLIQALKDEDGNVRKFVEEALKKIRSRKSSGN